MTDSLCSRLQLAVTGLGGTLPFMLSPPCPCHRRNLQVVKVRAESMAAAAKLGKPHGMLSGEAPAGSAQRRGAWKNGRMCKPSRWHRDCCSVRMHCSSAARRSLMAATFSAIR